MRSEKWAGPSGSEEGIWIFLLSVVGSHWRDSEVAGMRVERREQIQNMFWGAEPADPTAIQHMDGLEQG